MVISYFWRLALVQLSALIAVMYGLIVIIPHTKGLYYRLPVAALLCLVMGNFPYIDLYFTRSTGESYSSVGVLGYYGCLLFLIAQNLGDVTNMLYDCKNASKKQKVIAGVITSLIAFCMYLNGHVSLIGSEGISIALLVVYFIVITILVIFSCISLYKILIFLQIKDKNNLYANLFRPYNITLFVFIILLIIDYFISTVEFTSPVVNTVVVVFYAIYCITIIALLPLLERGRVKFQTLS